MDFSAQPSWTDNFPTGYFQPGTANPLYKKVTEHDLAKQRLSYYLAKGNNTGFQVPLNPKVHHHLSPNRIKPVLRDLPIHPPTISPSSFYYFFSSGSVIKKSCRDYIP